MTIVINDIITVLLVIISRNDINEMKMVLNEVMKWQSVNDIKW